MEAEDKTMDNPASYDADILAWSERQASVLRDLARTRRDLPNELDLENVAEEIECVGRSELFAAQSLIRQILIHLIKTLSTPDALPARHWRSESVGFHVDLVDRITPSMIHRLDMHALWRQARKVAEADLTRHGEAIPARLPSNCPLRIEEIVSPQFDFEAALQRTQNAMMDGESLG
jgi:Domain of unknown function DUF29